MMQQWQEFLQGTIGYKAVAKVTKRALSLAGSLFAVAPPLYISMFAGLAYLTDERFCEGISVPVTEA